MSSDEDGGGREAFEITDFDLENEFNPNRKRRRMTKEQAALGIFASDGEEDEEDGGGQGPSYSSMRMNFVSASNSKREDDDSSGAEEGGLENVPWDEAGDEVGEESGEEGAADGIRADNRVAGKGEGKRKGKRDGKTGAKQPHRKGGHGKRGTESSGAISPSGFVHAQRSPRRQVLTVEDPFRHGQAAKEASATAAAQSAAAQGAKASEFSLNGNAPSSQAQSRPARSSGFRKDAKDAKPDKDFGKWESHTKGIGMKLLKKMGWKEGEGLGKDGVGIVRPVEAVKRARDTMGLQEHGERSKQSREDFKSVDSEAEEEEEIAEQLQQWKVDDPSIRKRKPKYSFKTPEEVAAEAAKNGGGAAALLSAQYETVKIIDMTGKTTKVTTGYNSLAKTALKSSAESAIAAGVDMSVPMPELQHNVAILVELAESDIQRINSKLTRERASRETLQKDHDKLASRLVNEARYIQRLEEVIAALDSMQAKLGDDLDDLTTPRRSGGASGSLSVAEVTELFSELQSKYPQEYRAYQVPALAPSIAFPLIKQALLRWNPLDAPAEHLALFQDWQRLLPSAPSQGRNGANDDGGDNRVSPTPGGSSLGKSSDEPLGGFEYLCWETLMPCLRAGLSSRWDARKPLSAIAFLELWRDVIPDWIFDNILEQLLLPKIRDCVEQWNPTADPVPVHIWIHPWLPIMQERIEPLYPSIRQKLATCLQAWHPSDKSAHAVLIPWRDVFTRPELATFLSRSILPKLSAGVRDLVIDPANQSIEPITWLMAWRDMAAPSELGKILAEHFFPKFTNVLCSWLSSLEPNYDEVAAWYLGWKKLIDKRVLDVPIVRASLYQALVFMDRSVSEPGTSFGGAAQAHAHHTLPRKAERAAPAPPAFNVPAASTDLRDLVQQLADDLGVLYAPIGKTTSEGKPLYTFGKATIYTDRGVIFARRPDTSFHPVSMSELPSIARG